MNGGKKWQYRPAPYCTSLMWRKRAGTESSETQTRNFLHSIWGASIAAYKAAWDNYPLLPATLLHLSLRQHICAAGVLFISIRATTSWDLPRMRMRLATCDPSSLPDTWSVTLLRTYINNFNDPSWALFLCIWTSRRCSFSFFSLFE